MPVLMSYFTKAAALGGLLLLVLVGALLLLASSSSKAAPDQKLQAGSLQAVIKTRQRWYDGAKTVETVFSYGWRRLGADFYRDLVGEQRAYPPFANGVLLFPQKRMLVTVLTDSNLGSVVAGLDDSGGQARLSVLAGCMAGSRLAPKRAAGSGLRGCAEPSNRELSFERYGEPALFSMAEGFSYHGTFWIDYRSEEVHEVKPAWIVSSSAADVVGLTPDRSALLVLYRKDKESGPFVLCRAASDPGKSTCSHFLGEGYPLPAAVQAAATAEASAAGPAPSIGIRFAPIDAGLPARRAWLARHFDLSAPDGALRKRDGSPAPLFDPRHWHGEGLDAIEAAASQSSQ